jgi:trehalose 6-phosphate phosphatase
VLALDYDGTLARIAADPAAALPEVGAGEALARVARSFGVVAIITGRPAAQVVALLDLDRRDAPRVRVVGLYGRQVWTAASGFRELPEHSGVSSARPEVLELVAGAAPGVRLEDKGQALAVHFRGCREPVAVGDRLGPALAEVAARNGLLVQGGRLVVELLAPGPDKGTALLALAAEIGAAAVCFVGDDVGDLPAFAAIGTLRAAGVAGLSVAVANPESPEVARCADAVVADPVAVLRLLDALIEDVAGNG